MDPTLRAQFVASAAQGTHPTVRSWYDDAALAANCEAWLAPELRLVDDVDAAGRLAREFPVDDLADREFANRVVRLDDSLTALAGIRFRPDGARAAFVDLVATTRPLRDAVELREVAARLGAEFAGFGPDTVRTFAAPAALAAAASRPGDVVVAARVADLRAPGADASVALRRTSATTCYDHYLSLYRAFHAERPVNAELAHVEDVETLARFESDGGLFEVRVDGMFAGFCAARRWSRYGVRGWVGGEIILSARFRGYGHAASVHRRLAESIDAAPGDAIWAEVHEVNAPSWRSGLRAGYAVIGRVLRVPA